MQLHYFPGFQQTVLTFIRLCEHYLRIHWRSIIENAVCRQMQHVEMRCLLFEAIFTSISADVNCTACPVQLAQDGHLFFSLRQRLQFFVPVPQAYALGYCIPEFWVTYG